MNFKGTAYACSPAIVFLLISGGFLLEGQFTSAIEGTISDPSGAALPNATRRTSQEDTGAMQTATVGHLHRRVRNHIADLIGHDDLPRVCDSPDNKYRTRTNIFRVLGRFTLAFLCDMLYPIAGE
jgi:hypothetical protein